MPFPNIKLFYFMAWICLIKTSVCQLSVKHHHFVRCVTNICVRHFASERTLLFVKSPEIDPQVKTELLKHLHQTNLWSITLDPVEYEEHVLVTKFMHPTGIFMIYANINRCKRHTWYEIMKNQFISYLRKINRKILPVWDSRAKFLLIVNHECGYDKSEGIVRIIYGLLIALKFFNLIVIVNNPEVRNKITTENLQVYTYFPYNKENACPIILTSISNLTLLDTWVAEGDGHFINNCDLFPEREYTNLNGCPLRAIVSQQNPYVRLEINKSGRITHAEGIEIDLFKFIANGINATVQYHDDVPSFNGENSIYDVVFELLTNKADIAFGGTYYGRTPDLDGTNEYNSGSIRWYVPCGIKSSRVERIFKILTSSLWVVTALSVVLVAIAMVYFAKRTSAESQTYKNVGSSLVEVLAVILGVSVSSMPVTAPLRVFFLSWVVFCLSFNTVFLSYLTTYMIEPGYLPQIQNMDQLLSSDLQLALDVGIDFDINVLYSQDLTSRTKRYTLYNIPKSLFKQRSEAILMSEFRVKILSAIGDLRDEDDVRTLCEMEDGLVRYCGVRMYLAIRNPLLRQVNYVISKAIEAGIFDEWLEIRMHKWKIEEGIKGSQNSLAKYYIFNLSHMYPVFILLVYGYGLGVLAFVMELLYHRFLEVFFAPYMSVVRIFGIVRHFLSRWKELYITLLMFGNKITAVLNYFRGVYGRRLQVQQNATLFVRRDRAK